MDSQWRYRKRGSRTSRAVALAGIVAMHVGAVGLVFLVKGPLADDAVVTIPIEMSMVAESPPEAAPQLKMKLEDLPIPVAIIPDISISVPVDSTAITMASKPPAPAAPPPSEAGKQDGPVSVSQPDYLRLPSPVYPAAAKRARAQGVVYVRALVDEEGMPRDVRVERSSGVASLDKAACDAVLGALFKPYRRNNVARAMVVIVPVEFALKIRTASHGRRSDSSELDVRSKDHDAMRGHPEELGSLSAASLHPRE